METRSGAYRRLGGVAGKSEAERLATALRVADLPAGHRLLVVPDGPLHHLPFDALRTGGRYLVEDHEIVVVPASSRGNSKRMKAVKIGRRLVPALLVRDMYATLAFYERLGFQLVGSPPQRETATWAEVRRDLVFLQFHTEPPCGTPEQPVCSGTFYIYPESVAELADELRGKVEFACGPEVMDYGMREFAIQDPNGYFIAFTESGEGGSG